MDKTERVKELIKEINKHNYNYYVLDRPTISDKEWDLLYNELLELEKELGFVFEDSPTKKIGDVILKGFKKHIHKNKLYSLDKCNSMEELEKWYYGIVNKFGTQSFTVECKFDGLRMTLTYNNGILINAATRGNGTVGEDVTFQAKTITGVPRKIKFKGNLTVEGEALMRLSVLNEYNKNAKEPLKNARNAAAGAIRNLDVSVTRERNLNIYCYGIPYVEQKQFNNQLEIFEFLKENGFDVYEYVKVTDSFAKLKEYVNEIGNNKKHFDILLDGAVIKLNDVKLRSILGYTSKFPKWAIAYKFEAVEVTSILKDVIWQVGRTGKLTPIAQIEPVEIAGATVKRATLNNYGDIIRKDIKIGSKVFVRRSNEVIPEILGIAEHYDNSIEVEKPKFCPYCNSELKEIGANLFCTNKINCKEQIAERITHFAGKNAMNIVGLNTKITEQLIDKLNVSTPDQLYNLTLDELKTLDKFKEKKSTNLYNSIQNSKKCKLSNFIYSLGISGVGEKTSKDLAQKFKSLDKLINAGIDELISVDDVGEIIAGSIYDYFHNEYNIKLIERLLTSGIIIESENIKINYNESFTDKTIVLTGVLKSHSRDEAKKILEDFNANVVGSVSKNCDYVIAGEKAGSKLSDAKKLGIKILNEEQFLKLINKQN